MADAAPTVSPASSDRFGPVPSEERIGVIDCLRGAALFGILVANMRGFNAPMTAYFQPYVMWTSLPDRLAQGLVDWLVQGKFITIFAALFGVGFAIQMERAASRGRGVGTYARRLGVLFGIGAAHAFFLWWGDILMAYALCGFALMLFRSSSPGAIWRWANLFYWFLTALYLGMFVSVQLGATPPEMKPPGPAVLQETVRIYSQGSVAEIFRMRASEWAQANAFIIYVVQVVGIFLVGLFLWRRGYLQQAPAHLDWWKKAQRISLPIGLLGNGVTAFINFQYHPSPLPPTALTAAGMVATSIGVPALSLFYASSIVRLYHDPVWQRRLQPFTYVGRMALTNYLLQSLVGGAIFYSYGFGLYGRVGPLADFAFALAIYGLQIPFSRWWLSRRRYGPMEWVWRRLTYGGI
jgi:uncharacterized protein